MIENNKNESPVINNQKPTPNNKDKLIVKNNQKSTIKNLSDSINKDVKQLILGTVAGLIILSLIIAQLSTKSGSKMDEMVLNLMLGTAFGFVLARGAYGFGGAFRRPIQQKEYSLPKSVVMFLAITTTLVAIVAMIEQSQGLITDEYIGIIATNGETTTMSFMFIIGGLMFGIGMLLAGTSGSGTLRDIGIGGVGAIIVLVGWMFGVFVGFIFRAPIMATWMGESVNLNLFEELGIFSGLIVNLTIILIVYGLLLYFEKRFGNGKINKTPLETEIENQQNYLNDQVSFISNKRINRMYFNVFQKKWTFLTTAILLSIVAIFSLAEKGGWGVSSTYGYWGAWMLEGFGAEITNINLTGETGQSIIAQGSLDPVVFADGFWDHSGSMYNISLLLGSTMAVGLAGRFRIKHKMRYRNVLMFIIGGFIMGFATQLSGGSNIGALIDPIVVGELSGYVHGVLLIMGSWFTWKIIQLTNSQHI